MNMNEEFYKMLYEELDKEDVMDDEEDLCLISYETLKEDHIKLYCGHKFNYNELYKEVVNQKYNRPSTETQYLRNNEIKCPYCRTIQKGLLPPNENYDLIKYVNHPLIHTMKPNNCSYVFKSGKKKGMECNKCCYNNYCTTHEKILNKQLEKVENEIINSPLDVNICNHILLRGINKGKQCNKKIYISPYCKIHYNKH